MIGLKLFLAFSVLSGVFAEQCDLGDFAIDDYSEHVVVTNASTGADVMVGISFDHGTGYFHLKAGATRTTKTVGTLRYRITVFGDSSAGSYDASLRDLRDLLMDLSLDSTAPPEAVAEVVAQLFLVQSAVQQLDGTPDAQSCGHAVGNGVTSLATITWAEMIDGTGLWVLDCG